MKDNRRPNGRTRITTSAPAPAQPNQSLIDGLLCLSALAESSGKIGVSELSRMLGTNRTRTYRMLKTLAHIGFARQAADRKYTTGPAMGILAAQSLVQQNSGGHLFAPLNGLRRFGMTVAYGALWNGYVLYQYRAEIGAAAQQFVSVSTERLYPASISSIGNVLLAAQQEAYVRSVYQDRVIEGFPDGVDALLARLAVVRTQGYAHLSGEQTGSKPSLAVPIGTPPFAAVALAGDLTRDVTDLLDALHEAARELATNE
jgi:DNA-binding IclR family transcriptional regulator